MKKYILFSIIVFSAWLFLGSASAQAAANHYIRQGATGANNGSDWTNAWTNWPSTFTRGDTYYIADGTYSGKTFSTAASGSTLIYIKKATVADHGTDIGWSSTYGDGVATFSPMLTFLTNYWIFDGVTGGGPGSWDIGHGFVIYSPTKSAPMVSIGYHYAGPPAYDIDHIQFSHVEFRSEAGYWSEGIDIQAGAYGKIGSNVTISYCYFGPTIEAIRVQTLGAVIEDFIIEYCYFKGGEVDVNHHFNNIRLDEADRVTIRYNLFEDWVSTGSIGNYANAYNVYIYGNVFWNTPNFVAYYAKTIYTNSSGDIHNSTGWRIYNNSFVNIYTGNMVIFLDTGNVSDNLLYNNIFYNTNGTPARIGVTSNWNWYYPSFAHGEPNSVVGSGDPFVGWETLNFHLSAATNAGVPLTGIYTTDPGGVTRGADGVWDRGAYEYGGTGPVCTSHNYFSCYSGDVYWYDSCGNREDLKEDCGSNTCSGGACQTPTQICGNSIREGTEACDGTDLAGQSCISRGFTGGTLTCNSQCIGFVTTACTSQTGNLLTNGDFESGFTNGIANSWNLVTDGSVAYSLAQDTGYQGSSQKITISSSGIWGLFFYQTPAFQLNQFYNWSFWYKTLGTGGLTAEITNASDTQVVYSASLALTNGAWTYKTITFQYTNSLADELRFYSNSPGSYWIDNVSLTPVSADTTPPAAPSGLVVI